MGAKKCTNFKERGKAKLGRRKRAVCIEGPHVDDQGSFGEAFGLDEDLGIRQARMDSNKAGREEGVKHGLYKRAVRGFLRRCAGIS